MSNDKGNGRLLLSLIVVNQTSLGTAWGAYRRPPSTKATHARLSEIHVSNVADRRLLTMPGRVYRVKACLSYLI